MKNKIFFILICLLTGCQNSKFFEVAEDPGIYVQPITKSKYIYNVYGFYINKETSINDDVITYKVMFDNRSSKDSIKRKYSQEGYWLVEDFDEIYPSFIEHIGNVNCLTKTNNVIVNRLDANMKVINSQSLSTSTLVSEKLCFVYELSKET